MKKKYFVFLLFTLSLSAQIKGVVKDSITGKPIPYVNIWVQNENIGSTTEENGEFTINTSDKNKKIIFSALGFEKKTIKASEAVLVYLQPVEYQLEEVFISKRIESKQIEIGKTKNSTYQAFENGPRIDTKFFPYLEHYKKTKYIKKVSIFIDNKLDDASVKIHFYKVDKNGFPEEELLKKDFIVSVKSGVKKHLINVSDFNLTMPKNGIFVGFEKLIIEKNKLEKTIFDPNSNTTKITTTYFPLLLYNRVEREFLFSFSGGKWNKNPNNTSDSKKKMSVNEPAITLILTN
jgi:hypothetical protein